MRSAEAEATALSCRLFCGLSASELSAALDFFHAREQRFQKGEYLKKPGICGVLGFFGLVISGSVSVYMDEYDGSRSVMASVGPGQTFGESLCFLQKKSEVYIQAGSTCSILLMDTEKMRAQPCDPFSSSLCLRFCSMLAERTLSMNGRIQMLSKLSLRDKILAFLSGQPGAQRGKPFAISMNREDMAAWLGVNRSALSRELSALKKEGVIDFQKNVFLIRQEEAPSQKRPEAPLPFCHESQG